jgi:PHP family Zn ribbon phosphoesterase
MKPFKADLHIHTLLSPCGSLEMSPVNIIKAALKAHLDIIAITDHNSTKQAPLIKKMAEKAGLFVLCGAEINSREEVHCLTLFETEDQLCEFQKFLDQHLLPFPNKPELFGDQIVVDEDEMIVETIDHLLIRALDSGINEIEKKVHELEGLFIPAHIDRPFNGLFSQLGFFPESLIVDALELSSNATTKEWISSGRLPKNKVCIRSSDAHYLDRIGADFTNFEIKEPSFKEIKWALNNEKMRKTII